MRRLSAAVTVAACATLAVLPAPAPASISNAETIDGPSADIIGFDGAAMSEDGTGGIVYRKRVGGRVHIFAAQFVDGRWLAPRQVDAGQRFDSSWPAIGAADGGRLVVTWVQENGPESDRLFSATLAPGARRFGAPVPIDLNVGEATDTQPSLAMSRGGQGYLVYRVTKDPSRNPNLPPGTVEGEYRLARYTGELWSTLGFPINRNPAAPVSAPTSDTAPKMAIDAAGNGVVAWLERDEEFVDRVWARRVFGSQIGIPLLASLQKLGPAPLRAPADAFDLDVSGFGQAVVGVRQRTASVTGPARVTVAVLPESFVAEAAKFGEVRIADGLGDAGPAVPPGPPSVSSADGGAFLTAFGVVGESLMVPGDAAAIRAPERLDRGATPVAGDPQVDLAESGALAAAYKMRVGGRGQLQLVERRADGVADARAVTAARGGDIVRFRLAGSGLGDAIVGFQQGTGAYTQIGVGVIDAPPQQFAVQTPADFVRGPAVLPLRWDPASNAVGDVRYTVTVDDAEVAANLTRRRFDLRLARLDDGVTPIQVIAKDAQGQETSSVASTIKLDRRAPRVTFERRKGRRLRVVMRDGAKGQVSGVEHASARITWGDGREAAGRENAFAINHRYRRAGRYRVTVRVSDLAGNSRTVRKTVKIG